MTKAKVIERLNEPEVLNLFNAIVSAELGCGVEFKTEEIGSNSVRLIEKPDYRTTDGKVEVYATSRNLKANRLLSHIFEAGMLVADVYSDDNAKQLYTQVRIQYSHPDGGSNGVSLFRMVMNQSGAPMFRIY